MRIIVKPIGIVTMMRMAIAQWRKRASEPYCVGLSSMGLNGLLARDPVPPAPPY
jgi:hypothetical protein